MEKADRARVNWNFPIERTSYRERASSTSWLSSLSSLSPSSSFSSSTKPRAQKLRHSKWTDINIYNAAHLSVLWFYKTVLQKRIRFFIDFRLKCFRSHTKRGNSKLALLFTSRAQVIISPLILNWTFSFYTFKYISFHEILLRMLNCLKIYWNDLF